MAQKTRKQSKRAPHLSFYRQTYDFEGQTVVLEHLELAIATWEKKVPVQSSTICCIFQGSTVVIIPTVIILFSDMHIFLFTLLHSISGFSPSLTGLEGIILVRNHIA